MSIKNIEQPKVILINSKIRIKKYVKDEWIIALPWYQDIDVVLNCDGVNASLYDREKLYRMYSYLENIGELYFIEVFEENEWKPVGDVTLSEQNMPIVIEKNHWGRGIGKKVIGKLIERAKKIKLKKINIEIYFDNDRSHGLYTGLGFQKVGKSETSDLYELKLED